MCIKKKHADDCDSMWRFHLLRYFNLYTTIGLYHCSILRSILYSFENMSNIVIHFLMSLKSSIGIETQTLNTETLDASYALPGLQFTFSSYKLDYGVLTTDKSHLTLIINLHLYKTSTIALTKVNNTVFNSDIH